MTAISNIENAMTRTLDQATEGAHHALDNVTRAAHQASKALDATGDQLMHAQARLTKNCRNYVQEKPLSSLGIAMASGLVLGWFLHKR